MSFQDKNFAWQILKNISYYRLKAYWWEMQDDRVNHHFRDDSFFETAVDLYNFDRHFRLIVFNAVERVEVALRAKLVLILSQSQGGDWIYKPELFSKKSYYDFFWAKADKEIKQSKEEFIVTHKENHPDEKPAVWKVLEIISFGTLSRLYENLPHQLPEKNQIAAEFGLHSQKTLSSWLRTLTLIRNIIAHHGRLWNRQIINKYDWPATTPHLLLNNTPTNFQRKKIYPILSALMYLNDRVSPGHHLKNELFDLFDKFEGTVDLTKMGFPADWKTQPVWK